MPTTGYWVTDRPLDAKIPFVPQMVWFYVTWYPLFALSGVPLLMRDGGAFRRWMYYLIISFTASLIFYVAVPNGQNLRPADMEVTGASTWVLSLLWRADTCTNVFPSMHVIGCIGNVAAVLESKVYSRKWTAVIIILNILCAVSTVFVKQHSYLDQIGALAFALPVFFLVYSRRLFGKKNAPEKACPDRRKARSGDARS